MKDPVFNIDDEVEFEVGIEGYPRWDRNAENWYSEYVIERFKVSAVYDDRFYTIINRKDKLTLFWFWPLKGHIDYGPDQWERPGFIRKVVSSKLEVNTNCVCSIMDLMISGCPATHGRKCKSK